MNCPENENVCSVKKENNLGYYRLHTIWKSNQFFINITSRDGAWRGEMTAENIQEFSSQLEVSPETYMQQCKEALTCHDGKQGLVYAVEDGMFTWKKVVDEDSGIKIKMGYVMLEPASFVDTIQNLVSVALNCNKKLQNDVSVLTKEREEYVANRSELISKLNELIRVKEEMENDLYKRFLLLLNAKKRKILELENAIEDKGKITKHVATKETFEDPYEVETDDEDMFQEEISPRKRKTETKQNVSFAEKEAPEQKKAKNVEEALGCISLADPDFSQPGPSRVFLKSKNLEIPASKDELLDFFYGSN